MSSPSPPVLRELHHLNRSSPDFHEQLSNILDREEYQQCVPELQGDDLVTIVDDLEHVRNRIASESVTPC